MQHTKNWHTLPAKEVVAALKTNSSQGLTTAEAKHRLSQFGPNQLAEPPRTPWYVLILRELNDYLIYILMAGAILSISVGEFIDGSLIILIIIGMAVLGFYQNSKAEAALDNLRKMVVKKCLVLRDGAKQELESRLLVPGDIVILKAGDSIPADLKVIEEHRSGVDEATLTGESLPTTKAVKPDPLNASVADRLSLAYSGTDLVAGRLIGVVIATGMKTELGQIATLLESTNQEKSPLELQLDRLGKVIGTTLLGVVALVFALDLARGNSWLDSGLESIALAVAAVPEGLPAVITLCLAFGTREMAKRKALVRRLKAVEALGSVSIVATDKTGTLTTGEMSVTKVWDVNGDVRDMLTVASLCNNNSDMTERALTNWVAQAKIELPGYPRLEEHEFNSTLKRMSTIHQLKANQYLLAVKGAPEVILELCRLTPALRRDAAKHLNQMTDQGLRVIAFASGRLTKPELKKSRTSLEKNLELLGLVGLSDPPKAGVKEALAATRRAGIHPIMITGDNARTALAIARDLGFPQVKSLTGQEIDQLVLRGELHALTYANVFARVTPSHKTTIIQAFQKDGHYVAMIGDGVNDAPSIKLANVGVAMGIRGSDVTRGAADLVLLDDNYSTLVSAIEGGRNILNRIRRFVSYLLSCNIAEVGVFLVASLLGMPFPLTPVMLLVLNLVTDAAPALALSVEPADNSLMNKSPRPKDEPIITSSMWLSIAILTIVTIPPVLYSFHLGGTTMAFATLSFLELFRAYTTRSLTLSLNQIGFFTNRWTTPAVFFGFAVTLGIIYLGGPIFRTTPLPLPLLGLSLLLSLTGPLVEELSKPLIRKFQNPTVFRPK